MIGAVTDYIQHDVLPRCWRIVFQLQTIVAVALAAATYRYGVSWPIATLKLSDTVTMTLTYAAIALGFCITGMALVLTLPGDRFARFLAKNSLPGDKSNSYLDLLFVFSWTAVTHWLLIVCAICAVFVRGGTGTVLNVLDGRAWKGLVSGIAGLCLYDLVQFLLTVITLSQVGRLYSRELTADAVRRPRNRENTHSEDEPA
jgi:hypothetical protein